MIEAEREFVEAMGRHFEVEGVPRIGGRMFAFLLLRETPCSLDDLVEELAISKASASTNARLLEQWALIRRTSIPGDRRDYYTADPDQTRTLEFRLARVREYGDLLRVGAGAATSPVIARRLDSLARFHVEAIDALEPLLAKWRAREPGA